MITIHEDVLQGSDEWLQLRCGLLTASEMHLVVTAKKLMLADNDKSRGHLYEMLSQRITQHVEPSYVGDAMLQGNYDEVLARDLYSRECAEVAQVGFITRSFPLVAGEGVESFSIGYSPDGLVGAKGGIEVKSRKGKYQVQTILDDVMPDDYLLQVQTGMLVADLDWIDFVSYCGGLPMFVRRIPRDLEASAKIEAVARSFYMRMAELEGAYHKTISDNPLRMFQTERARHDDEAQITGADTED